jgi:hypothetical protein
MSTYDDTLTGAADAARFKEAIKNITAEVPDGFPKIKISYSGNKHLRITKCTDEQIRWVFERLPVESCGIDERFSSSKHTYMVALSTGTVPCVFTTSIDKGKAFEAVVAEKLIKLGVKLIHNKNSDENFNSLKSLRAKHPQEANLMEGEVSRAITELINSGDLIIDLNTGFYCNSDNAGKSGDTRDIVLNTKFGLSCKVLHSSSATAEIKSIRCGTTCDNGNYPKFFGEYYSVSPNFTKSITEGFQKFPYVKCEQNTDLTGVIVKALVEEYKLLIGDEVFLKYVNDYFLGQYFQHHILTFVHTKTQTYTKVNKHGNMVNKFVGVYYKNTAKTHTAVLQFTDEHNNPVEIHIRLKTDRTGFKSALYYS